MEFVSFGFVIGFVELWYFVVVRFGYFDVGCKV